MNEPKYGTPEWDAYVAEERARLEAKYGEVWSTPEVETEFNIESFLAPFCAATRRSTGKWGTLMFQPSPRFYFSFEPSNKR